MIPATHLDLFAGIPVADYAAALLWYERLLGYSPTFFNFLNLAPRVLHPE